MARKSGSIEGRVCHRLHIHIRFILRRVRRKLLFKKKEATDIVGMPSSKRHTRMGAGANFALPKHF